MAQNTPASRNGSGKRDRTSKGAAASKSSIAALPAGKDKLISIRAAREHNLRTVDLDLPRDGLIASADAFGASRDIAR